MVKPAAHACKLANHRGHAHGEVIFRESQNPKPFSTQKSPSILMDINRIRLAVASAAIHPGPMVLKIRPGR
ncbi:hypothetical protein, partial [Thiomonas sp.]|uniref:hypothetical protein n=1 Tax=Thiomonas sp. TaxID=2047785 RepID=UPI00258F1B64